MASGTRHLIVAAFLVYVQSVLGTEAQRICDGNFHHQVYWTCAGKRSGGSYDLHSDDKLAVKRVRGLNFKRSAGTTLGDAAFLMSGLEKRSDYDGIASFCCLKGCTPEELSVVC
nr:relaxin-like gonad-stimulating peptide [Echinaster spinulosus]